jgi:hypothetical protein
MEAWTQKAPQLVLYGLVVKPSRAVSTFVGAHLLPLALACGSLVAQTPLQGAPLPSEKQPASSAPATVRESGNLSSTSNINGVDLKTGHAVAYSSQLPKIVPPGRSASHLKAEARWDWHILGCSSGWKTITSPSIE